MDKKALGRKLKKYREKSKLTQAKLAEKTVSRNEAKGLYQKIITKYPDSYYAYRASKHISNSHNPNWNTKYSQRLPEKRQTIAFPFNHTNIPEDEDFGL